MAWTKLITAGLMATALILPAGGCAPATSQTPDNGSTQGVDESVDYEALRKIGPWDDRNYQLTAEDLDLLAANEATLKEPIPAFFRVLLRRANPEMQSSGPAQYPRSALQTFFQLCGGYLQDGRYYRSTTVDNGQYRVLSGPDGAEVKKPDVARECQLRTGNK